MNEDQPQAEKDFRSLIEQFNGHSETRDKIIREIDDILDRIKQNRRPSAELKQPSAPLVNDPPVVVLQFRELIRKVDLSNERLAAIISRLNELV
jgi:hypothetical protein